jgi:hypothetical protein
MALSGNWGNPMRGEANLPAGLHGKIRYPHPVRSTAGTRRNTLIRREVLIACARSAGELDDEALTHEVGTIYNGLDMTQRFAVAIHTESYGQVSIYYFVPSLANAYQERRHARPLRPCTR